MTCILLLELITNNELKLHFKYNFITFNDILGVIVLTKWSTDRKWTYINSKAQRVSHDLLLHHQTTVVITHACFVKDPFYDPQPHLKLWYRHELTAKLA